MSFVSYFHSLKSVERSDAGQYWCQVEDGGKTETSQSVWLTVEGEEACGYIGCPLVITPLEKKSQGRKLPHCPLGPDCTRLQTHSRHWKTIPTGVWELENQGSNWDPQPMGCNQFQLSEQQASSTHLGWTLFCQVARPGGGDRGGRKDPQLWELRAVQP